MFTHNTLDTGWESAVSSKRFYFEPYRIREERLGGFCIIENKPKGLDEVIYIVGMYWAQPGYTLDNHTQISKAAYDALMAYIKENFQKYKTQWVKEDNPQLQAMGLPTV